MAIITGEDEIVELHRRQIVHQRVCYGHDAQQGGVGEARRFHRARGVVAGDSESVERIMNYTKTKKVAHARRDRLFLCFSVV